MRKWIIRIAIAVLVILGSLFGLAKFLEAKPRPIPEKIIGYTQIDVPVAHRAKPMSVHIWYPTDSSGQPELFGQNGLFYGFYAHRDAPGLKTKLPLVVVSHGSGGNAVQLGWLAAALAEQGMVVAAVNHQGTTSRDSDPFQTIKIWERPQDLTALIDFALKTPPVGLQIDAGHIATLGFSLGGHSAMAMAGAQASKDMFIAHCDKNQSAPDCKWMREAGVDFTKIDQVPYESSMKDARVSAVVAIDPALPQAMTMESLKAISVPMLLINLGEGDEIPVSMRADALSTGIPNAQYHAVKGAAHFSFLAECSALGRVIIGFAGDDNICADPTNRSRGDIHQELISQIVPFLKTNFLMTN